MNNLKFKKNELYVEGISVKSLTKKFITPFYCYSSNTIVQKYKEFEKSLKYLDKTICYAVKANPNVAILKMLAKLGAGAEVVSEGELKRALIAGIHPKKIVFSGVGKKAEEIIFAIKKNILQINIESEDELKMIENIANRLKKKVQIGIRVNPNIDAETHKKITTGRQEDKFGLNIRMVEKIFKKYKYNQNLDVVGLSVHIGSQIMSINPFKKTFLKLKKFINKINNKEKIIKVLDLGGGIGINYKNEKAIAIKDYVKIILNLCNDLNCKLIVEPGRMLVAESGILVTKVLFVKKNKKTNFLVIDAGMNDLMRPALYDAYHEIKNIKNSRGNKKLYTIVGPICETADTFVKDILLNKINSEDFLFISNVGAYGSSMSSSYNSRPIIMELMIHKKKLSVIRKINTVDEQITRETMPGWINKIK
ncbi:MAG: Diaminopimelate decarboxylase [Alphaproteobacteria bacterium MarineAlpha6_Bin3]|nr:MAG: Diaminopimelate decarboxylase [Alphaproteobacteria bacterium MarineAlpha6_Bin3]